MSAEKAKAWWPRRDASAAPSQCGMSCPTGDPSGVCADGQEVLTFDASQGGAQDPRSPTEGNNRTGAQHHSAWLHRLATSSTAQPHRLAYVIQGNKFAGGGQASACACARMCVCVCVCACVCGRVCAHRRAGQQMASLPHHMT